MTKVVAALIRDQDKFMICQGPAHKARGLQWEFVGGKVEAGKTREQTFICRRFMLPFARVFLRTWSQLIPGGFQWMRLIRMSFAQRMRRF